MIKLSIRVDADAALSLVRRELPAAVPYVRAVALTKLAGVAQQAVQQQLPVAFDRPTPYTVRGVFVRSASRGNPVAEVYVPDSADQGGRAAREYMQPGVKGSSRRRQKRTEVLLSRTGWLPPGWVTTPGSSTAALGMIDGYGNLKGRIYAQVINVLQIKRADTKTARDIAARSQARAQRMGVAAEFFAVKPGANQLGKGGSWLPPGVYRRRGRSGERLEQILKFVRAAAYRPRLDFEGVVSKAVQQAQSQAFDEAFAVVKARFSAKGR